MVLDAGLHVDIQVDGGINRQTLPAVLEAGANVIVAGSSVFGGNICHSQHHRHAGQFLV